VLKALKGGALRVKVKKIILKARIPLVIFAFLFGISFFSGNLFKIETNEVCAADGGVTCSTTTTLPPREKIIEQVIAKGQTQLRKPYCFAEFHGGLTYLDRYEGGYRGYDCSSFVAWAYYWGSEKKVKMWGVTYEDFPKTRKDQNGNAYSEVPFKEAKRGDLVYYDSPSPTHVGIYLGEGKMIHAGRAYGPSYCDQISFSCSGLCGSNLCVSIQDISYRSSIRFMRIEF